MAEPKAADDSAARASACAEAMWALDRATRRSAWRSCGVAPGEAMLAMTVRPEMTNGHHICHGGFIFTLADSTFAFACNSHGPFAVAQHCAVTFLRPVREGERLVAHAVERSRGGRSGIYDITVRDIHDRAVAEFRGHSRTIAGDWLTPSAAAAEQA